MEQSSPSEIEYTCPICMYLLIEPVTLPCKHSFCLTCYRKTVEISNLTCPICRMRISVWARKASKSNTLIDQPKWHAIKEAFPLKVRYRLEGEDHEENIFQDDHETQLRKLKELSRPGEIRLEYEAELEKLQRQREEEAKREEEASAALIRALQQEADEEMAEQLRLREELEKMNEEAAKRLEQVSGENRSPVPTKRKLAKGSKKGKKNPPPIKGRHFLTLNTFFNTVSHSSLLNDSPSPQQNDTPTWQLTENQFDPDPSGQQHQNKSQDEGKKTSESLTDSHQVRVSTLDNTEFYVHHQPHKNSPSGRLSHFKGGNLIPADDDHRSGCGHNTGSHANKAKPQTVDIVLCHDAGETIVLNESCDVVIPGVSAEGSTNGNIEGDDEVSFKIEQSEESLCESELRLILESSGESRSSCHLNDCTSTGHTQRSSDTGHTQMPHCQINVGKSREQNGDKSSSDEDDGDQSLTIKWDSEVSLNMSGVNSSPECSMLDQVSGVDEPGNPSDNLNGGSVLDGGDNSVGEKGNKTTKNKVKMKMGSVDAGSTLLRWLHTGGQATDRKATGKRKRWSSGLGEGTSKVSPGEEEMAICLEDVDQSQMTQEEFDHLVALRLQKMYEKLDKNNIQVDRFKGSKDQYSLRKKRKRLN